MRRASFLAALMLGLPFSVSTGGNLPTHGALPAYPHDSVSSDGLFYSAPERSITASGTRAYRGTADRLAKGEAADGLAEYRQEIESAEEVWSLLMRKPAKSGYSSETIIGLDSRTRVNPTTSFPARATALITFNQGSGSFICTGWLINKNTVATAGHCVHTGGPNGSFSRNVRVYPGRNGSQAPFGSCTARTLFTVVGWANASDERYDYGAVKLNCNIGQTTGWYGLLAQSMTLNGQRSIITGYPGDKPLTQWRSTDQIRITQPLQLFYKNDTLGGMSGSPVYNTRPAGSPSCSGVCAIAIHAQGLHGIAPHSSHNHGTRITQSVLNNLIAWRNAP